MRSIRGALAATTAMLAALTLWAAPAHADIAPPQPFSADSTNPYFDTCPHGITKGTLLWQTPGPVAPIAVQVSGQVVDRPTPSSTTPSCAPDDYSSTAIFTAYSGSAVVGYKTVTVDNGVKQFQFTLGGSTGSVLTALTVQVCRDPVHTLPPSYCGKTVTYRG
ncbi:hypothetical protein [Dactylosporangium sp. NPDC050588]|uniref:hypothetical protein n=1 Tax=Dactylosporangium sp. NPDC050588 TaxID=3157211 RepID=UPI0034088AEB